MRYLIYKSHLCNPLYVSNKNYISNHYDINSQTELCKIGLVVRSQVLHVRLILLCSIPSLTAWTCLFGAICQLSLVCLMTASYLNLFTLLLGPINFGLFCFGNQNSIGMRGWDNGSEGRWRIKNIFSPYPAEVDSQKMMSSLNLEMIQ